MANSAVSNLFVIISGSGVLETDFGKVSWHTGDIIAIPFSKRLNLSATSNARIYWVNDEPLINYLGVIPKHAIFDPTYYPYELTKQIVQEFNQESNSEVRNRNGVLLGNAKCSLTKTITPTLWALYNVIAAKSVQAPHQHNSVALDLCFTAKNGVYTLMSKNVDNDGKLVAPVRMDWKPGAAFITPPAWWLHIIMNQMKMRLLFLFKMRAYIPICELYLLSLSKMTVHDSIENGRMCVDKFINFGE